MMMNNTLAQLPELKLVGMATAVEEQLSSTASTSLSVEERLALMVDREVHQRADKRHAALLKRGYKANEWTGDALKEYEQMVVTIQNSLSGRMYPPATLARIKQLVASAK